MCCASKSNASGFIFINGPGIIKYFNSFNTLHPPPDDPAEADQTPACVQGQLSTLHTIVLLFWTNIKAFSITSVVLQMALLLLTPSMSKELKALDRNWATQLLQCISTGRPFTPHPACWLQQASPTVLVSFISKASSKWSSLSTISANRATCSVDSHSVWS